MNTTNSLPPKNRKSQKLNSKLTRILWIRYQTSQLTSVSNLYLSNYGKKVKTVMVNMKKLFQKRTKYLKGVVYTGQYCTM